VKSLLKIVLVFCISATIPIWLDAQVCSALGQNPTTAFPVCGLTVFVQNAVPLCGNRTIPTLCNDGTVYGDKNPYWYKFTCYLPGKLGFLITPSNLTEDYDWQLYDVTGVDPMDIYSNKSLIISANWSGSYGITGASSAGVNSFECSSNPSAPIPTPTFSVMPDLIAGHDYLLLVSHYTDTQSGYKLSFQGGTASIINPVTPLIQNAYAICDGTQMVIALNKKMKCSSLALDGSDFVVSGNNPNSFKSASGKGCVFSFDLDTVVLNMITVLSPGNYTITSQNGTDGNTLIDNCGNSLDTGVQKKLVFTAAIPTAMDSITPVVCIKDTLQLLFNKPMDCKSIAADGTDFQITGPSNVSIKSAFGLCSNGISSTVSIVLQKAIKVNGTYIIKLVQGSDGNSLINECGTITPIGSSLNFIIKNVVTADFIAKVKTGCKSDTLSLMHDGNNAANSWKWNLDNGLFSSKQQPLFITKIFGKTSVLLETSNGICTDTSRQDIDLINNTATALFSIPDTVCAKDSVQIIDQSNPNTISWKWDFGNGQTSLLQQAPILIYNPTNRQQQYIIRLEVSNNFNCKDTAIKKIMVLPNCYVDIPSAFTPNGDGLNDYLYPLNAFKAIDLNFKIYNRFGQVIFETQDWKKKWDGRINGILQPSGTYVYLLEYTHKETGKKYTLKGTTVLIR
jgi:gliding motility-associated-like protein